MNIFLLRLSILAQGDGLEGLINIVIVIFLAVSWIIGGIVKARSEQARTQKNKKLPPKPPHRPSLFNRESAESILEKFLGIESSSSVTRKQQKSDIQSARPKVPYTRPAKEQFFAKPKSVKSPSYRNIKPSKEQKFSLPTTIQEPELKETAPIDVNLQELPEFSSDAVKKPESTSLMVPKEITVSQSMLDLTDSDSLKRAILYYEILGKPLSLRDE